MGERDLSDPRYENALTRAEFYAQRAAMPPRAAPGTSGPAVPFVSQAWRADAACRDHPHPEWWLPVAVKREPKEYDAARQICRTCPVIGDCLDHALRDNEREGMWGGHTPKERWRIRKARGQVEIRGPRKIA
jgi:WhiB family redox-sensing transcriptional regulator